MAVRVCHALRDVTVEPAPGVADCIQQNTSFAIVLVGARVTQLVSTFSSLCRLVFGSDCAASQCASFEALCTVQALLDHAHMSNDNVKQARGARCLVKSVFPPRAIRCGTFVAFEVRRMHIVKPQREITSWTCV